MYKFHEHELRGILTSAAEMGAQNALIKTGNEKTQINQAEAYRRYGRTRVARWVKSGKVVPVKIGGNVMYKVSDLESISQTIDLIEKNTSYGQKRIEENGRPDVDVQSVNNSPSRQIKKNRPGFNSVKRQKL